MKGVAMAWSDRFGTVGVWRRFTDIDGPLAQEVERLGYGTIWQGGSPTADLRAAEAVLDGTRSVVVATGIVNIWKADAAELAASYRRIVARHPGRLVLGIGTGHREATPHRARPLSAMAEYLDVLDEQGVPASDRVLSALGPRMLEMAAERSIGTHPYLTVPVQTRAVREAMGPDFLIAPEQTVVFGGDRARAMRVARSFLASYLRLDNYVVNMKRGGFTDEDVAGDGSDELVDAIVAHGDADDLASRVDAHLQAGADHVCVQVLPADEDVAPALRALADALDLPPRD